MDSNSSSGPGPSPNPIPIMKVKPQYNSSRSIIKLVGQINHEKELGDELIEIPVDKSIEEKYGTNLIFVNKFGSYNILAKFYSCNILSSFLQSNTKLPIFYMTVIYERQFVSGFLLSYYLYFTIDDSSISFMNEQKQILNTNISGTFSLEFVTDKNYLETIIKFSKPRIKDKIMLEYVNGLDSDPSISPNHVLTNEELTDANNTIDDRVNLKINAFRELFKPIILPRYTTKNNIIETHMKTLCANKDFIDLVSYGVELRDEERRTNNFNSEFKMPKRVFNLKAIRANPNIVDELLDSDGRSSDDTDYD